VHTASFRTDVPSSQHRLKINWKRAKHWITSPDPQYLQKNRQGKSGVEDEMVE